MKQEQKINAAIAVLFMYGHKNINLFNLVFTNFVF